MAARRLGFPIAGSGAQNRADVPKGTRAAGWETPPDGVTLAFHMDTNALRGVPATVPFPKGGDLRWRPASEHLAAPGSIYTPLARLKDSDGNSYGDGIVYIEYTTPPLQPGRIMYVWMRMPEVLGMDELLFALFRFAGERVSDVP